MVTYTLHSFATSLLVFPGSCRLIVWPFSIDAAKRARRLPVGWWYRLDIIFLWALLPFVSELRF